MKSRIVLAKEEFNKKKEFLTKGGLSRILKKRMVKVLVWPVAFYGCEIWTLRKEEINKLEALEMWLWKKLEKIKWQDKISIEEVLTIVDENRCLMRTISERKKNWIGHVLRGDGLLRDVLEGRMLGRKPQGRPSMGMIDELREIDVKAGKKKKESYGSMKRRAEDRQEWRVFCDEDMPEGRKL